MEQRVGGGRAAGKCGGGCVWSSLGTAHQRGKGPGPSHSLHTVSIQMQPPLLLFAAELCSNCAWLLSSVCPFPVSLLPLLAVLSSSIMANSIPYRLPLFIYSHPCSWRALSSTTLTKYHVLSSPHTQICLKAPGPHFCVLA